MARLTDGHPTLITFSEDSSIEFWVTELTPPSIDSGGPNDTTTMHNDEWRTRMPKSLKTLGEMTVTGAFGVGLYTEAVAMAGVNQLITVTFPDEGTLTFWGWLDKMTPRAMVEGVQPTVELTIVCGNMDNNGDEVAPVVA